MGSGRTVGQPPVVLLRFRLSGGGGRRCLDRRFGVLQNAHLNVGAKVINRSSGREAGKIFQEGKTLEEDRKLVERSFGNYGGSNVMVAAVVELVKIQQEIEILSANISKEAIDKKWREWLSEVAYQDISEPKEQLRIVVWLKHGLLAKYGKK